MNLFRRLFNASPTEPKSADKPPMTEKTPEPSAEPAASAAPTPDAPTEPLLALDNSLSSEPLAPTAVVTKPLDPDSLISLNLDGVTRELSPDQVVNIPTANHLLYGVASHVGSVRSNNQDAAFTLFSVGRSADEIPDFGLFIVADGMGGHHDGEKASALVSRAIATHVTQSIYMPLLMGENVANTNQTPMNELLIGAVEKANSELNVKVPDGGTTLSSCLVIGSMAFIAHVGDSRIYLIQRDQIEQITRDHSLVQRLIELDQLTPEEAVDHPQHNVLYRALGQNETVEVDTLTRRLPPRSRLLICSDGLWNLVKNQEMLDIVQQTSNPQDACNKLVTMANMRGGMDNITVVLLYMPG
jgi:protein phosphatase